VQGTPVVNQLSSGRCWLFATTNVIRLQVIKELNLKELELSQSYLAFWDKLEKSNTFLENAIELADKPLDDRIFGFLKTAPTNDGGQWDMVTNLIKKYGLVPKAIYPESYNSSNSSQINWLLTVKLREYALELRDLKKESLRSLGKAVSMDKATLESHVLRTVRSKKDEQMAEVYRMMVIALGVPPKPDAEFNFEYYDKNDKFHSIQTTPLGFLDKYTGSFDPAGACSLVNDPRRGYNKLLTVDRLQNVWGGQPVLYVNTTTSQMKACVVATIKAGLPAWFGNDVGQFSSRNGIMDTALYDYELTFGIKLGLSKAERLEMGESSMTHAMVITGVHLDSKGNPVRYRVENSWGPDAGEKGYMVMTDAWFDQFVYQVVIRKQHMPASLWKLFEDGVDKDTDVLPCYDPMGSLA
jgi:bleomycin hydrolase